jgi:hypothetical protein
MAKDDERPKTVTLGLDELNALIAAGARAAVAEAQAKGTVDALDFDKAMKLIRGGDRPAAKIRHEDCVSPLTGASFRAKVVESKMTPLGRVIDLEDYTWPDGVDVPVSQGGLMPDAHLRAPAETHAHWKYWEFMRRDLNEFASGKAFTRYLLKSEHERRKALDTAPVAAE